MQKKMLIYFVTLIFWFIMLYVSIMLIRMCENNIKRTFDLSYSKYIDIIYGVFFILLCITIVIIDQISQISSLKENICQVIILGLPALYLSMSHITNTNFIWIKYIIYPNWISSYSFLPMLLGNIVLVCEILLLKKVFVESKRK